MDRTKFCSDQRMHKRHKWFSSYKDDNRVFHICPGKNGSTKAYKKDRRRNTFWDDE